MKTAVLYHASTLKVMNPLTNVGRADLDFGPGFYLTKDLEQAVKWAVTQASRRPDAKPVVNRYNFDADAFSTGKWQKKIFTEYSVEWLDFVAASRKGGEPWKKYDWIEGGIANDAVISTVDAYVDGFITASQALDRLINEKVRHQICISNQRIIDQCLKFDGVVE